MENEDGRKAGASPSAIEVRSSIVEGSFDAHWRKIQGPSEHRPSNAAVVQSGRIRREREILGVAAKVTSDPGQLGIVEDSRPCHNCGVSPIGVMLAAQERLHIRSSLSATTLERRASGLGKMETVVQVSKMLISPIPSGVRWLVLHE